MTLAEIIAALKAEVGDDSGKIKEAAKLLRDDVKDVAQKLINVGAGQKSGDADKKIAAAEKERDEWKEKAETTEQEFAEFKSKTPDVATVEARERAKWEQKVKAKDDELKAAREQFKGAVGKGGRAKFTRELIALGVDPEYAESVAAAKYGDRLNPKDDGVLAVYQLGETTEYDAPDEDAKIKALAADVRKLVSPKFINTNADSGGGANNRGSGTTYDAAKVGTEMGKAEREQVARTSNLAFT
jgi:hypothetical protein